MKIDKALIDKYLNQRATAEEIVAVKEWLATDEGQSYLSNRLDEESTASSLEQMVDSFDREIPTMGMKQRFMAQIHRQTNTRRQWLKYAAMAIPFLFLSFSLLFVCQRAGFISETQYAELSVPCGEQMTVVLQDGTIVHLNSQSHLRFPKQFSLFQRDVQFSGEAYFKVAKKSGQPFVLTLNGLSIKVLGTEFNVKSYPSDSIAEVYLREGKVELKDHNQKAYHLLPGELAVYNLNDCSCQITPMNDDVSRLGWRTREINFHMTRLSEILQVLQRQYEVSFNISDSSLLTTRFTLSTHRVRLDDILNELEEVSHVRFTLTSKGIYQVSTKKD